MGGTSFDLACHLMLACTRVFFVPVGQVPKQWKTSVSIAGLVTGELSLTRLLWSYYFSLLINVQKIKL